MLIILTGAETLSGRPVCDMLQKYYPKCDKYARMGGLGRLVERSGLPVLLIVFCSFYFLMKLSDVCAKINFLRRGPSFCLQARQRLFMPALAVLLPGAPQLFKRQFIAGSLLFVFGVGALIDLGICACLSSPSFRVFDVLAAISMPNLFTAFPNLQTFSGEATQVITQPCFRVWLTGHILLYALCAGISFRQQRHSLKKR